MKMLMIVLALTLNNAAPYAQTETWVWADQGQVVEEQVYWVNPASGSLYLMYDECM